VHTAPCLLEQNKRTGGSPSDGSSTTQDSGPLSTAPDVRSASEKLFADAALEEEAESNSASPSMSRVQQLANQTQHGHDNWTGDEEIKDAVLRMLVDKYKPLRSGEIQSAEEKMKKGGVPDVGRRARVDETTASLTDAIITGSSTAWKPPLQPTTGSWANEPLLPSNPSHKPWDTKYSVPWHREAAIKTGNNQVKKPKLSEAEDANQKKRDREAMRRQMIAGRLTSAREATLDYKLGIKRGPEQQGVRSARPNPSTMKGWGGYVEDKIEVCYSDTTLSTVSLTELNRKLGRLVSSTTSKDEVDRLPVRPKNTTPSSVAKNSS
jgi:DnaJ homolog subfamily C member 28